MSIYCLTGFIGFSSKSPVDEGFLYTEVHWSPSRAVPGNPGDPEVLSEPLFPRRSITENHFFKAFTSQGMTWLLQRGSMELVYGLRMML
ncbi:hypothetical protein Y1Q_0024042 [Alligator mississippiensis]|uniref:Uncharacterized protein n=1 Tax=Alligator mississippiensis TaxID=8496 RepID=A0A151NIB8_ALLMI|nr:hypothetical protein Y1Q_0024042 [Alligator mississippiensis]